MTVLFDPLAKVSIPYRCNETHSKTASSPIHRLFQFLIGAMRPESLFVSDGEKFVSIPYRCNETIKDKLNIRKIGSFNSL